MKMFSKFVLLPIGVVLVVSGIMLLVSALGRPVDPSLDPVFDATRQIPPPVVEPRAAEPLRTAFYGDLHVHTSYSSDAFIFGVRALPDDAYVYARGGQIAHAIGYPIQLSQPLDFLAVTDHSEFLGTVRAKAPSMPLTDRSLREILTKGNRWDATRAWMESVRIITSSGFGMVGRDEEVEADAWRETIAAAERHNDPGVFTSFVGYEWSSQGIHRNVVFASADVPDRPFSSLDSNRPQDLWLALEAQNERGQRVIAIPHNGNESLGRMYPDSKIEELEWTEEEAERRRRIEPISEIYQVKGASETHPSLSPDDEFAAFEVLEPMFGEDAGPAGSYTRDALRTGLELSFDEGWNPYVFGVIGSSDGHNASSNIEEDRPFGKLPMLDGSAAIRSGEAFLLPKSRLPGSRWGSGGLAVLYAEENTRASLFASLERRETFATSGTRISVRFFGGWNYSPSLLDSNRALAEAYREGVPMGGVLDAAPENGSPGFVVWADKDPLGANLDRIQIIKGWIDGTGESFERVFDVAASGDRQPDPETGRVGPVGNSVDVKNATYSNSIGQAHLETFWSDPDFDPSQSAFYYVRVLEIPTPRMSTFDAVSLGIEPSEPSTIQERAATSAIWYSPKR